MGRSQQTFNKKAREEKRMKKRKEKAAKKEERKANTKDGNKLDEMIAYVNEFGQITETEPDPAKKTKVKIKDIVIGVPKREKEDPVRTGTVTNFNQEKGYGFIRDHASQESHFVHISGLDESLQEINIDDKVTFELMKGEKGLNAVKVKAALAGDTPKPSAKTEDDTADSDKKADVKAKSEKKEDDKAEATAKSEKKEDDKADSKEKKEDKADSEDKKEDKAASEEKKDDK